MSREVKVPAALSREEWKQYFSGHWSFAGERKRGHEAPFPEELPRRLIRMFSLPGDTVLDPFLGTGTTAAVALALGRNAVGYDVNEEYARAAAERCRRGGLFAEVSLEHGAGGAPASGADAYAPAIPDLAPAVPAREAGPELHLVKAAHEDGTLLLDDGRRVAFLGVRIARPTEALAYLRERVVGKRVMVREERPDTASSRVDAYVYLKNRIFVNSWLLRAGLAEADSAVEHRLARKFDALGPR